MVQRLRLTRLGNPILRQQTRRLSDDEIRSRDIQELIVAIHETVEREKAGVGLAAPQVGIPVAMSLIAIKPTPNRPNNQRFESVIINPEYEGVGRRRGLWEGCISIGRGRETLFGKVPRYATIRARWQDGTAVWHHEELKGFVAHVFQHETDHLNGIVFTDLVRDRASLMMADEYRKRVAKPGK